MSGARVLVGVAVLGLAAWAVVAYARQGEGGQAIGSGGFLDSLYGDDAQDVGYVDPFAAAWNSLQSEVQEITDMTTPKTFSGDANVLAFLDTIKRCEGTFGQPDPFRVCFAYRHTIQSFADHPAALGEWGGEKLSDAQCAGAGFGPGCVSTAAGAFQITRPTWKRLKAKLGLPDFSPDSQVAAAVELLRERGAYARLQAGDLAGAVEKARKEWASLPGANYAGQGMRSMAQVQSWYTGAGGGLA